MSGKQILSTERLLLREFDQGDAEAFYPLGSDSAVTRYTSDPGGGFTSVTRAENTPLASHRRLSEAWVRTMGVRGKDQRPSDWIRGAETPGGLGRGRSRLPTVAGLGTGTQ